MTGKSKKVLVATLRNLDGKMIGKYQGLINALENMGFDVWFTGIKANKVYLCKNEERILLGCIKFANIKGFSGIFKYRAFFKALIKIAKADYEFDYCYFRCTIQIGLYGKTLKALQKAGIKTIVEIPTHPSKNEHKSDKRLWRKPIYKFMECNEKRNSKYVDLFALMGEKDSQYWNRPAINIENGVDMDSVRQKKMMTKKDETHFIAVAKMARWHGYDRFIEGLQNYKEKGGTEKIVFHVVGPEGDGSLAEYKSLVEKYALEDNVVFHGTKQGEELAEIFDKCDVAIACLGVHRKNMDTISELKVREYMARGIPFVYSTHDYAIKNEWDYCLKVSDNEEPVDIFAVVKFAKKVKNNQELSNRIRKDCTENMTWEIQMKLLFDYFEKQQMEVNI